MSTTPTFYYSTDASAPTLALTTAGEITKILDACLVNGYGSKAAVGWTIPFTDTNIRVYRAPAGNRFFLRVDATATNSSFRMNAFANMTSVNSGTEPFVPSSDEANTICGYSGTAPYEWAVIANNRFFYIYIRSIGTQSADIFYFGDLVANTATPATPLPFGTVLGIGQSSSASIGNGGSVTYGAVTGTTGRYMARDITNTYVATGTRFTPATQALSTMSVSGRMGTNSFLATPETISGSYVFEKVPVVTWTGTPSRTNPTYVVGFLPGLFCCLNSLTTLPGIQPVTRFQINSGPLNGTNLIMFRHGSSISTTGTGFSLISENVPWE